MPRLMINASKQLAACQKHLATLSITHPHLVPEELLNGAASKQFFTKDQVKPLADILRTIKRHHISVFEEDGEIDEVARGIEIVRKLGI